VSSGENKASPGTQQGDSLCFMGSQDTREPGATMIFIKALTYTLLGGVIGLGIGLALGIPFAAKYDWILGTPVLIGGFLGTLIGGCAGFAFAMRRPP
jgi:hypothetical protein